MLTLTASATTHVDVDDALSSDELDAAIDAALLDGILTATEAANTELDAIVDSHTAAAGLVVISDSTTAVDATATDTGLEVTVTVTVPASAARNAAA